MKKNQLILISIIIFFLFILIFFHFSRQGKNTSNSYSPIPILENSFQTVYQLPTFTSAWPDFPQELPFLNFTLTDNILIKEKLNDYCQTESILGSFYQGKVCTYYYYNNNQNLEVVTNIFPNSDNLSLLTLNEANQKAQTFMNAFITDTQSLTQTNITYLAGGDEAFIVGPEEATFIQLNYNYTYQGIPILEKNSNNDSFLVILSQAVPLQKAELPTQNLTFTPQNQFFKLISLSQALKNISQGKAYLSNLGDFSMNEDFPKLNLSSLKQIQLNQVALEYRYENSQQLAIPYYRFFGTGIDNNKNSFNLQIFTPAIKVD